MKVIVCGLKDIAQIQEAKEVTKVLSLLDFSPYLFFSKEVETENTLIFCRDIEGDKVQGSPTPETIQKILKFSGQVTNDDVILIHCAAGVSRSPAAAMIIAWDHLRDAEEVEKFIRAVRPGCAPNRLMCKLADSWFNNKQPYLSNIANKLCNESHYRKLFNDKTWMDGIRK